MYHTCETLFNYMEIYTEITSQIMQIGYSYKIK